MRVPECTVCFEVLKKDLACLSCGHVFHYGCIKKWVKKAQKRCPLCRQAGPIELVKLVFEIHNENEAEELLDEDKLDLKRQVVSLKNHNKQVQETNLTLVEKCTHLQQTSEEVQSQNDKQSIIIEESQQKNQELEAKLAAEKKKQRTAREKLEEHRDIIVAAKYLDGDPKDKDVFEKFVKNFEKHKENPRQYLQRIHNCLISHDDQQKVLRDKLRQSEEMFTKMKNKYYAILSETKTAEKPMAAPSPKAAIKKTYRIKRSLETAEETRKRRHTIEEKDERVALDAPLSSSSYREPYLNDSQFQFTAIPQFLDETEEPSTKRSSIMQQNMDAFLNCSELDNSDFTELVGKDEEAEDGSKKARDKTISADTSQSICETLSTLQSHVWSTPSVVVANQFTQEADDLIESIDLETLDNSHLDYLDLTDSGLASSGISFFTPRSLLPKPPSDLPSAKPALNPNCELGGSKTTTREHRNETANSHYLLTIPTSVKQLPKRKSKKAPCFKQTESISNWFQRK